MRRLSIRVVSCLLLGLCGCVFQSPPKPTVVLIKPISCDQQCLNIALKCGEVCHNSCTICQAKSKHRTSISNTRYTRTQHAEGRVVARELNSFRDPLACTKVTCDCMADFKACKQRCHGPVIPKLKNKKCIDSEIPCDYWLRDILAG